MSSRIQKSIANAKVNIIFYVLTAFLTFFSRKVFLNNLGTEFIGLSGTLGDILNLMNITELGIGTAVGVTLYKPLFDNNRAGINNIVSVFGYLYSRVGRLIALAGVGISLFFPLIFETVDIALWVVYLMFYSMLYSSLLGYLVNYRQIILTASQQNYIVSWLYNIAMMTKVGLQMAVSFLPYNYAWWILLEVVAMTVYTFILNRTINRYFPHLKTSIEEGKSKFKHYKHLWVKTKQVFAHKLSHLFFTGSINIVISIFASISAVALYGNYNLVMSKVTALVDGVFTGMSASVGNLLAEGNIEKTLKVFFELLSVRYYLASVISITLFFSVPRIIEVWLGSEYVLSSPVLIMMSIHIFIQQARLAVENFKDGYGLYSDVWAPLSEVIICITLASLLGHFYGLTGILGSYVIGEVLMKIIWKPYYLFKKGFHYSSLKLYWPKFCLYIIIAGMSIGMIKYFENLIGHYWQGNSWLNVIAYCLVMVCATLVLLTFIYWVCDQYFRVFVRHMMEYKFHR